ncbi:MAG: hypothetical protein ACRCXZ_08875 [Patescibacteria group bacterium]
MGGPSLEQCKAELNASLQVMNQNLQANQAQMARELKRNLAQINPVVIPPIPPVTIPKVVFPKGFPFN